jgi:hypothetical protein
MKKLIFALGLIGLSAAAFAQKSSSDSIAEYRAMLQDGNPAELFEAKGEDLWKQKRGPKNASLEKCDLGKCRRCQRRVGRVASPFRRYRACARPRVSSGDVHARAARFQR